MSWTVFEHFDLILKTQLTPLVIGANDNCSQEATVDAQVAFQLHVKTLVGSVISINVEGRYTFAMIKAMLQVLLVCYVHVYTYVFYATSSYIIP